MPPTTLAAPGGRLLNHNDLTDMGGASSFGRTYFLLCQLHSLPVLTEVLRPTLHTSSQLHLDIDRIRRKGEWTPLLQTLHQNRDLVQISVFSNRRIYPVHTTAGNGKGRCSHEGSFKRLQSATHPKKCQSSTAESFTHTLAVSALPSINPMLVPLFSAIYGCLSANQLLTKLEIMGFSLSESSIALLAKGLARNKALQELSLARTDLGDSGLFQLCPAIRNLVHLRILNLSACNLTEKGAHVLAKLLKSLTIRRQAERWAGSLRLSAEDLERYLIQEEMGLLALDLQHNSLTDHSAHLAQNALKDNFEILILDMRNNCIDDKILYQIHDFLLRNDKARTSLTEQLRYSGLTHGQDHRAGSEFAVQDGPDLQWLDSQDPLKDTYHLLGPTLRQHMHTESSAIKRRVLLQNHRVVGNRNVRKERIPKANSLSPSVEIKRRDLNADQERSKKSTQTGKHLPSSLSAMIALESYLIQREPPVLDKATAPKLCIPSMSSGSIPSATRSRIKENPICNADDAAFVEPPKHISQDKTLSGIKQSHKGSGMCLPLKTDPAQDEISQIYGAINTIMDMDRSHSQIEVISGPKQQSFSFTSQRPITSPGVSSPVPHHTIDDPIDLASNGHCHLNQHPSGLHAMQGEHLMMASEDLTTKVSLNAPVGYPLPCISNPNKERATTDYCKSSQREHHVEITNLIKVDGVAQRETTLRSQSDLQNPIPGVTHSTTAQTIPSSTDHQIEMLVKMMESSICNFHAVLDHLDEQEDKRRQHRRTRKSQRAHQNQHVTTGVLQESIQNPDVMSVKLTDIV
ncbi:hypothetical protein BASA50_001311 [Batrachochytrium salamandrivorans]|uniref:Uncharacterized protein n=1 Tax=Batrachochytrium salamandrivorans TaxID=1357716 RepID=A0ABQ8EYL8_9FUNG|nr:hypothetical protein BASA62_008243 [Batrachochytrium salamandrivorans]KAH6587305.1 hypothetical protein BASA50_001311 [Batrachochytrium salamandrivorans]KAH6597775.1 hypothetical protein BASA61_003039 [Batrachochytrium salamandrivorans]